MHRLLISAAAAACALLCSASALPAGEKPILRVCALPGVFAPSVIAAFEEANSCIIALDPAEPGGTMLDSLEEDDAVYDVIAVSGRMAKTLFGRGMLQPLDHALLPGVESLDPETLRQVRDAAMIYSVPFVRILTGIEYNAEAVGELDSSWSVFSRRDLAGKMTMMNDMRESIGAALKHLGYSLNTTDDAELAEAAELLREWRDNLAGFETDPARAGLLSGEADAAHNYAGGPADEAGAGNIRFLVPEEGTSMSTDVLAVMSHAENVHLAHTFINFLLDPDTAEMNMRETRLYMPIPEAAARVSGELEDSPAFAVPPEVLARSEVILDLGPDNEKYEAVWALVTSEGGESRPQ